MRPYVFSKRPRFCLALKPKIIWVRCPKCGNPHQEYLGPRDRDEKAAERAFIRAEYQRLAAIVQEAEEKKLRRRGSR